MYVPDDLRKIVIVPRGQSKHEWIYWKAYGKRMRRPYVIPYDPKTIDQIEVRNKMWILGEWWKELNEEEKKFYNNEVKRKRLSITGYNYFFKLKFQEVTVMVKQVTRDRVEMVDGVNYITIPEIILQKTFMFYNSGIAGVAGVNPRQEGIKDAWISSPTEITVNAQDSSGSGNVFFAYQLIEYV